MTRSRAWCFTIYPGQGQETEFKIEIDEVIRFAVYQIEITPKTDRIHIQGYVQFHSPKTLEQVKTIIGEGHYEIPRGTVDDNIKYCSKYKSRMPDTSYTMVGTPLKQGQRRDLEAMYDLVKEGEDDYGIMEAMPATYMRFFRSVDRVRSVLDGITAKKFRKLTIFTIIGKPGIGKTRCVYDKYGFDDVYSLPSSDGTDWFNGYTGQKVLLIDDFYGRIRYGYLLKLLDGYPIQIQTKGGFAWALWETVIITSNSPVENWYTGVSDITALKRRITKNINPQDL